LRKKIFSATFLLALSQLFSRILGVARDRIFAHIFGATGGDGIFNLDLYFAAFRLPDLVYSLLIFGTLSAAFVPLLVEKKGKSSDRFVSNVLNFLLLTVVVLGGVVFIFAEPLTKIITPGFSDAEIILTAKLLRIQLLAPLFFTFSAIFGGLAQHVHKFFYYSLAPIFYNLGIILGAVFWGEEFGVIGISWGVTIGAATHAVIQLPVIFIAKFRWCAVLNFRELQTFFRLAGPRVLALVSAQLQLVVITIFASILGRGTLSVFNFSWNLASFPLGIAGLAFATTSFARLARLANSKKKKVFRQVLQNGFLGILFWVLPAAVGLFFLRNEITSLILQTGEFGATDVTTVAQSLAIFSFAIPAISLLPLLNNVFFAQKNTRVPLFAGLVGLVVATFSAAFFAQFSGTTALATAYSLATLVTFLILVWIGRRNFIGLDLASSGKILILTTILGGLVFVLRNFWPTENLIFEVSAIVFLGGIFYLALAKFWQLNPRNFC